MFSGEPIWDSFIVHTPCCVKTFFHRSQTVYRGYGTYVKRRSRRSRRPPILCEGTRFRLIICARSVEGTDLWNGILTPYNVGLALAAILAARVALAAYRSRDRPGGLALALAMAAVTEWSMACLFEGNAVTVRMKVLWSQVAHLGTLTCGPFLLYFASAFTRHHRLLKSPVALFALWSVPAVSLVLAFTNGSHGLIWSSLTFRDSTHRVLDYGNGAMWRVMAVHVYTVVAIAAVLLATDAIRLRHIFRSQSIAILVSLFPPVICNAIYAVDPQFFRSGDPSPVVFALTGLILSYSFSRLQLFDLVPVARDRIVEGIQDGVVVLDARGRIVDANAAAEWLVDVEALVGIVNAHGGQITLESADTNTTFSVWLPAPAQQLAPPPRTPGVAEAGLIAC